jgi:hypothetical protein
VKRFKKLKSGQGPTKGCRGIIIKMVDLEDSIVYLVAY